MNVGKQSIIRIGPGIAPPPSGGGGGGVTNDPTFPAGDLTLEEDDGLINVNMVNSGTTPAAVEFSFSSTDNLVAVDPDDGSPDSPSFVVDPDSSPRVLQFRRGPLNPGTATAVTASYSSPSGPVGSFNVTVSPGSFFGVIRSVAEPTLEFSKGSLTNTGTLGSSYNWIDNYSSGSVYPITDSADPRYVFRGYHLYDATGRSLSTPAANSTPFMRHQGVSRTWLMAYESAREGGYNQSPSYLSPYGNSQSTAPGGLIYGTSTGDIIYYHLGTNTTNTPLDTSHSHTDGGSSEKLQIYGTFQKLCVVAIIWNHITRETTTYWKQQPEDPNSPGNRAGFSYMTQSATHQFTNSNYVVDIIGQGANSKDAKPLKTFYYGVFDTVLTAADFQRILNAAGIP